MTVYIDEIFVMNLLMDMLVLWAVAKLLQRRVMWGRLLAAGVIGALYSVIIFFPGFTWLAGGIAKALCAFLMIGAAFGLGHWQGYVKAVVYLYLVSFAFGGGTIALMYFCGEWIVQTWSGIALMQVDFSLFWLIGAVALLLLLVHLLHRSLQRRLEQHAQIVTVHAALRGRSVSLRLLVDSGNCLTDPLTGKSVAVVQTVPMRPLFTQEEYMVLSGGREGSLDVTEAVLRLPHLAGRVRLIPFQSVGYQGMLLGIRMDCLLIDTWGVQLEDAVLALSLQQFAADGAYQGVIAPVHDIEP